MAGEASKPSEEAAATLLVHHLPEGIPYDTLYRILFSDYGAFDVRPCTGGKVRNCAFIDFKSEALASQAQHQLNGLLFLGKVLWVEKASKPIDDSKSHRRETQFGKGSISSMKNALATRDLDEGLKRGSLPASESIAERPGVDYPFPPHLECEYPAADRNIVTNIGNALIADPRFYIQVLHLMKEMNLPAPFHSLPMPPLKPPPPPSAAMSRMADLSSGESELESSDEEVDDSTNSIRGMREVRHKQKRIKQETILGPAVDKDVAHEDVGLKPATLVPKEIPVVKKKTPVLHIKIAPKQMQTEQKHNGTNKESEVEKENSDLKPYTTPEELESGKLPPEEILSLPMCKNYTAGCPASVLYIKNLAKDVVADDFYFIFGSLFGSVEAAKSCLSVKVMQEGRMRGQAFVTFPSVELAHRALNLANGYVFKGKPMIIQFGRNPAAAKAN